LNDFNHYLVKETCQYLVIVPVIRGRMLDDLIWPMHTLTILQAEDLQEKPWAYFPQESADVVREDLCLEKWDAPGIRTANQLSRSVATLRQLTSQVSEFQDMPDPTEPGMERLQTYLLEELSETLSTSLQTFFDAAAELLDQYNALSTSEQQHRDKLRLAAASLIEAAEYVHPAEGDGSFELDLAEILEYARRLEEVYPVVEEIRLSWITDILEQLD
jgi:hypothetical protein